eukprot:m.62172 g.62172  ORF g.62172 m.62172 type:complete len:131 (-) comp13379_c1_seq3:303-695(-)
MSKIINYEQVAKHNSRESCFMVIHDKVYDVTKFLVEHPGGEEVMLDYAGKDATDGFEDVGHSEDARAQLEDYFVGDLPESERGSTSKQNVAPAVPTRTSTSTSSTDGSWVIYVAAAVVIAGAAVAYLYLK